MGKQGLDSPHQILHLISPARHHFSRRHQRHYSTASESLKTNSPSDSFLTQTRRALKALELKSCSEGTQN